MISPIAQVDPSEPVHSLVGQLVGKYRVVKQLGRGGMGTVYEAVHAEIGQHAAIKVLNANVAALPEYARRFIDEARAVSTVGHPGLVKVFDYNQFADGTFYILMELLAGESLAARLARLQASGQLLAAADATRITRQLASALAAVHAKGIIHRDLKPENIVLVPDPDAVGGERAKILDFGIAKLGDDNHKQTAAGTTLGTPTYMSPEQCEGLSDLTDRADSYAVGVMLFEMLSGRTPFDADSTSALMRQHMMREPPQLPAAVPLPLRLLCKQLLDKKPTARPSMAELVAQLDSGKRSAWWTLGGRLQSGRHAAVFAVLAVLLTAGVAAGLWRSLRSPSVPPVGVERPLPAPVVRPVPPTLPPATPDHVSATPDATRPGVGTTKPTGRPGPSKKRDSFKISILPDKRRGSR